MDSVTKFEVSEIVSEIIGSSSMIYKEKILIKG